MKILITGGAGYVGAALVQELQYAPFVERIVVFDNLSRGNFGLFTHPMPGEKKVQLVKGDLLDTRLLEQTLDGVDAVIHLAARVTTPFADSEAHSFDQINHWGTSQLINLLEKRPMQRVILLSSVAVYGHGDKPATEASPTAPASFYAVSKLAAEQEMQRLEGISPYLMFRSGNVYGYSPTMRFDAVVNRFAFEAQYRGRIRIFGSGKQLRPFVHVDTVARCLAAAVRDNSLRQTCYNLAEHNLSIMDLVDEFKAQRPSLELIFENKEQPMRSLSVEVPSQAIAALQVPVMPFGRGLSAMFARLNFGS